LEDQRKQLLETMDGISLWLSLIQFNFWN
jgi:hypothetical protein